MRDRPPAGMAARLGGKGGLLAGGGRHQPGREVQAEDGPAALAVECRDGAAHGLDKALGDGETEPDALAGGGVERTVEAVEDAASLVGGNAWAAVADLEQERF